MKTNRGTAIALLTLSLIASSVVQAESQKEVTIVNHFDRALPYTVKINPAVLPDLPTTFTLAPGEQIHTRVLDIKKEAYIGTSDNNGHTAFFGLEVVNDKLRFYGYIGKGIAYSWNTNTIVFCTPEEYKQKKGCI